MARFASAREMGITVDWRLSFIPFGVTSSPRSRNQGWWRSSTAMARPDAAEELLLYIAIAHEAISRFAERIAALVPPGTKRIKSLDSEALNVLRADFLRFQSRDFTLDVSRIARQQEAFNRMADALGLRAHYHEVQSGLDRLAEMEGQFAEERLSRADTIAQAILFAIAVAGLLQSVVAVATWTRPARWPITGGVLLLGLAAWGLVERGKRKG